MFSEPVTPLEFFLTTVVVGSIISMMIIGMAMWAVSHHEPAKPKQLETHCIHPNKLDCRVYKY